MVADGDDVFAEASRAQRGYFAACAAFAAWELGVWGALDRPRSSESLARALGVSARRLKALLDVLVLDGALVRQGSGYARGTVPPRPDVPEPSGWGRLAEVIRRDRPLDAAAPARFHAHLEAAGRAAAEALAPTFAPGALLDAGGGTGTYARAFLAACPTGRAVVIDRAEVLALARPAPRLELREGDLFTAPLDEEFQTVLASNLLHLYGEADCARLVARLAGAVAPGGRLVVKDLAIAPDRSGPPAGVLFALNLQLFTDGGDVHDAERISGWLRAAGLSEPRVETLACAPEGWVISSEKPPATV